MVVRCNHHRIAPVLCDREAAATAATAATAALYRAIAPYSTVAAERQRFFLVIFFSSFNLSCTVDAADNSQEPPHYHRCEWNRFARARGLFPSPQCDVLLFVGKR